MTLFLCSLGHIWVGQSSLFLFWVVNWIYLLCCMALLMVLTQSNSFHPVQQPLSNIIVQHSFLHHMHHMFADDTELYNSTHCSITDSLVCNIQNCVSNVKKKKKKKVDHPQQAEWNWIKIRLRHCSLTFSNPLTFWISVSVLTIGSPWSYRLTWFAKQHTLRSEGLDQFTSLLLLRPQKPVMSGVLPCLDNCNSLFAGIPQKLENKVQHVMYCAVHLDNKAPKHKHVTPFLWICPGCQ